MHEALEELIKNTKEEYYKTGDICCPAFDNEFVRFNKHGFTHLLRKDGQRRSEKEQKRRVLLFQHASKIVSLCASYSKYREEFKIGKRAQFWELSQRFDDKIVCVIIRQIENGPKHFFSIKDSKV